MNIIYQSDKHRDDLYEQTSTEKEKIITQIVMLFLFTS